MSRKYNSCNSDTSLASTGTAVAIVSGLDSTKINVIQAWFFTESHNNFNQIVEQIASTSTMSVNATGTNVVEIIHNGLAERILDYSFVSGILSVDPSQFASGDQLKVTTFIDNQKDSSYN